MALAISSTRRPGRSIDTARLPLLHCLARSSCNADRSLADTTHLCPSNPGADPGRAVKGRFSCASEAWPLCCEERSSGWDNPSALQSSSA